VSPRASILAFLGSDTLRYVLFLLGENTPQSSIHIFPLTSSKRPSWWPSVP